MEAAMAWRSFRSVPTSSIIKLLELRGKTFAKDTPVYHLVEPAIKEFLPDIPVDTLLNLMSSYNLGGLIDSDFFETSCLEMALDESDVKEFEKQSPGFHPGAS